MVEKTDEKIPVKYMSGNTINEKISVKCVSESITDKKTPVKYVSENNIKEKFPVKWVSGSTTDEKNPVKCVLKRTTDRTPFAPLQYAFEACVNLLGQIFTDKANGEMVNCREADVAAFPKCDVKYWKEKQEIQQQWCLL